MLHNLKLGVTKSDDIGVFKHTCDKKKQYSLVDKGRSV